LADAFTQSNLKVHSRCSVLGSMHAVQ